ncbi:MAG: ribose 5-phosphate isomerase B [Bdellovibrionota bacterium]
MKLFIAADHAGFELKENLKKALPDIAWEDLGTHSKESVHYPEYAKKLAEAVIASKIPLTETCGILICGSGIGVSIAANRYPEIRAALVGNEETARLSREHNRANVLCLAARSLTSDEAKNIVKAWTEATFQEGRHAERVAQLAKLPKPTC